MLDKKYRTMNNVGIRYSYNIKKQDPMVQITRKDLSPYIYITYKELEIICKTIKKDLYQL